MRGVDGLEGWRFGGVMEGWGDGRLEGWRGEVGGGVRVQPHLEPQSRRGAVM